MRRSIACALPAELWLLLAAVGCREAPGTSPRGAARGMIASSAAVVSLAPRPAGSFACTPGRERCEQLHPRLPDTGEWLCAERDGVVWCSGGDAAAGVVSGPADPSYRCGPRWGVHRGAGATSPERVCIDRQPDYPVESAGEQYRCRFLQERGVARLCERARAAPRTALPERGLPACFLDQDCPAGRCERGTCGCRSQADCRLGHCSDGTCVEAVP